jgi:hypothetical protein
VSRLNNCDLCVFFEIVFGNHLRLDLVFILDFVTNRWNWIETLWVLDSVAIFSGLRKRDLRVSWIEQHRSAPFCLELLRHFDHARRLCPCLLFRGTRLPGLASSWLANWQRLQTKGRGPMLLDPRNSQITFSQPRKDCDGIKNPECLDPVPPIRDKIQNEN